MIKSFSEGGKNFIKTSKTFTYANQNEFRTAYESFDASKPIIVNMADTDYVDSAALGMLLILREYLGDDKAKVIISNPTDTVLNILKVSNFQKIFTILE